MAMFKGKDLKGWEGSPKVVTGYQCDVVSTRADYNGMLYEERGRCILAHTGERVIIDAQGQPFEKLGDSRLVNPDCAAGDDENWPLRRPRFEYERFRDLPGRASECRHRFLGCPELAMAINSASKVECDC
jgi:hypothetical protein